MNTSKPFMNIFLKSMKTQPTMNNNEKKKKKKEEKNRMNNE